MQQSDKERIARSEALRLAQEWSRDRASIGTHPGAETVVSVAEDYYKFLTGQTANATKAGDL